jgi:hypothetical protein
VAGWWERRMLTFVEGNAFRFHAASMMLLNCANLRMAPKQQTHAWMVETTRVASSALKKRCDEPCLAWH